MILRGLAVMVFFGVIMKLSHDLSFQNCKGPKFQRLRAVRVAQLLPFSKP
jgi:hypothetical protein